MIATKATTTNSIKQMQEEHVKNVTTTTTSPKIICSACHNCYKNNISVSTVSVVT